MDASVNLPRRLYPITIAMMFALAGAISALTASAFAFRAQDSQPVSLYVTVEQGDKLVTGLKQSNFRLYEDGRPTEFRLEQPERPVSIALLVEYSRSSSVYFNDIQAALLGFMKSAPQGDWLALATFSKDLEIRMDFTKERGEVEDALGSFGPPKSNEIDTYDAVYEMLDKMANLKGRRVLILIGSGFDTFSKHTLDDVRKKTQSSNVTIYGVGAGSLLRGRYEHRLGAAGRVSLAQSQSFMQMLANESGGEAWFPKFESAFAGVINGIIQSLNSQYRLVYTPQVPADGKFHAIKIDAFHVVNDKRQDFKVRARAGWRF